MSDSSVDALFFLNSEMSLRWVMTLLHFLWQGCHILCDNFVTFFVTPGHPRQLVGNTS